MMNKILIPLPAYDFDPTEVAIPWKILIEKGFEVCFATPDGKKSSADPIMLSGEGLGFLKSFLMARADARKAYEELLINTNFSHPLSYEDIVASGFQGLILPGGHAQGMKTYLESELLQKKLLPFFVEKKAVGAICHGVVLAARIKDFKGQSILYQKNTTALLKSSELLAYKLTKERLQTYYLTYPELTVEDEVKGKLEKAQQFKKGPLVLFRDSRYFLFWGFSVTDGHYVSARWPGDVYNFTNAFLKQFHKSL